MLEYSPEFSESNFISYGLNQHLPDTKITWPIIDASTKKPLPPDAYHKSVQASSRYCDWQWPDKKIHFISDLHADADALLASLTLSGSIKRTGIKNNNFILTPKGKKHRIIIGGDCLDKGPSNLSLLRTLKKLFLLKKNTVLLAGNHDMRLYMGLKSLQQSDSIASQHFFIRMGNKVLPLFKEVYQEYLADTHEAANLPSAEYCKKQLFPSEQWQNYFTQSNKERLMPRALQREIKKIHHKWQHFESACRQHELSLPMVYLAAKKCYSLFMEMDGEFFWFFNEMKLLHREKSILFTHAGIDNKISRILKSSGIKKTNQLYKELLHKDLCYFYYGSVANALRTKYRKNDPVLTERGVKRMHQMGIHAIVHGHISQSKGQNITLRAGMLHFECDITLDINSRSKAGLCGLGSGFTTISPKGKIQGISGDAPHIKVFQPGANGILDNNTLNGRNIL